MPTPDLGPAERPPCPECAPGAPDPCVDPDTDHIHLTPYGYLLYFPGHDRRDWVEEIRAEARSAAANDLVDWLAAQVLHDLADRLRAQRVPPGRDDSGQEEAG